MNATDVPSTASRFAQALDGLCRAVAARIAPGLAGWAMSAAMIVLVWGKIRRVEGRIQSLLAQFQAGRLRTRKVTGACARRERRPGGPVLAGAPSLPVPRPPRHFAWLLQMVPWEAACFAGQLRVVLAEPDMVALLQASAQARRVLAPLCRMLGIEAVVLTPAVPQPLADVPAAAEAVTSTGWQGGSTAVACKVIQHAPVPAWWSSG